MASPKWNEKELQKAVMDSRSMSGVYQAVGITGGNSKHRLLKAVRDLGLDTSHFNPIARIGAERVAVREEAKRLRESGLGYVRIGKDLGVSWNTIRGWVGHIKIPKSISQGMAATRQRKDNPVSKSVIRSRMVAACGNHCDGCGLTEWRGIPLSLELHRMEKGEYSKVQKKLLCPNCHSITPNWRGRGKSSACSRTANAEHLNCSSPAGSNPATRTI